MPLESESEGCEPETLLGRRIPSLDGLRAVAIGMVVVCHFGLTISTQHGFAAPQPIRSFGFLGVTIFFVISGFLITTLLLNEIGQRGSISLARFYFARTFRLLPAYYALIGFIWLGHRSGAIKAQDWHEVLVHALTYTTNYCSTFFWYLGHSWSLAVEEQFYLLWPAALIVLGIRRGLIAAALLLLVCPIVRFYYSHSHLENTQAGLMFRFESVADAIAAGSLLGGTRKWLKSRAIYNACLASPFILLAPIWIVLTCIFPLSSIQVVAHSMTIAAIAVAVEWVITFPESLVGRFLNSRMMISTGAFRHSLYLWQQPFLNPYTHSAISRFPINIVLAVVAALFSYHCIERPGLALRERLGCLIFPDWRRAAKPALAGVDQSRDLNRESNQ